MDFREATPADLDSITDLVVATFPMDPGWNYCYPKRLEYPEDHRSCVREKYQNAFKHKDRFIVRVITVPSEEDASVRKLISVASWKRGYTANPSMFTYFCHRGSQLQLLTIYVQLHLRREEMQILFIFKSSRILVERRGKSVSTMSTAIRDSI